MRTTSERKLLTAAGQRTPWAAEVSEPLGVLHNVHTMYDEDDTPSQYGLHVASSQQGGQQRVREDEGRLSIELHLLVECPMADAQLQSERGRQHLWESTRVRGVVSIRVNLHNR